MKWLNGNRLDDIERRLDLLIAEVHVMTSQLVKMGNQQGFKFKREKNPRRVEVGKRSWAARKAREAEAAQGNGLLGLVEKASEG